MGDKGQISFEVSFELAPRLRGDGGKQRKRSIYLGVLVVPARNGRDVARASYALTVCEDNTKLSHILRKLHFDFEPVTERKGDEIKPTIHLQLCGELTPRLRQEGYEDLHIQSMWPHFEKPRVPCMPMSLAILLNWVLLEFQTDRNAAHILRHPTWRKRVAQAERVLLRPYFKACHDFLSASGSKDQPFMQRTLYEIA